MSYFSLNLSKNLKCYDRLLFADVKPAILSAILQICRVHIENNTYSPDIFNKALQKLEADNIEIPENFSQQLAGLLIIIQTYLRAPKGIIKNAEFNEAVMEYKLSEEYSNEIFKMLVNRTTLAPNYYKLKCLRTPPKSIQYRINITLIESRISRLAQPTIVLHIIQSNGEIRTFELSKAMFHRLRFGIANLLKEMQTLERKHIMKI